MKKKSVIESEGIATTYNCRVEAYSVHSTENKTLYVSILLRYNYFHSCNVDDDKHIQSFEYSVQHPVSMTGHESAGILNPSESNLSIVLVREETDDQCQNLANLLQPMGPYHKKKILNLHKTYIKIIWSVLERAPQYVFK